MLRVLSFALLAGVLTSPVVAQEPNLAALFERGVSWETFVAGVKDRRELWTTNTRRAAPAEAMVARLKKAGAGLQILAIAEGACSDSVSTIPYLARLAAMAGVELRIVGRDAGKAVMEQHRTPDRRAATPTVVLMRHGKVAGVWVERPWALQTWFLSDAAMGLTSDEKVARKMAWYDWDRGDSTVAEIVALAEKAGGTGDGRRR